MTAIFECREYRENAFRSMEVQICGETKTVQFCAEDHGGDHPTAPSVAINWSDALDLANWILSHTSVHAQSPLEVRQHIAWLFQYVQGMNEQNWHDMKLRAERQLEQLSLEFPGPAFSSTDCAMQQLADQAQELDMGYSSPSTDQLTETPISEDTPECSICGARVFDPCRTIERAHRCELPPGTSYSSIERADK